MSSLAPSASRRSRRAAASLRTSARMSLVAAAEILRTPGSSIWHRAETRISPPAARMTSERCARMLCGGDREELDADRLRQRASSICVQSLSRSSSRSATRKAEMTCWSEAPSSSVRSKATPGPSRLTRRFATLVAMISLRSRCARMASAWALRIGFGKAVEQLRLHQRVVRQLELLGRVLEHELGDRQDDRELRPRQAAVLLAAPQQLLARIQALRPCGRAGRTLREARSSGRGRAARSRRPLRRSKARASAGGCPRARCRRPRPSSARAGCCACRASAVPRCISRLSGILMFTSLSEQSTPALLSMKSVLMRPPCSANSMRAGLGDGEVRALTDHLCAKLDALGSKRVVRRDRRRRPGSASKP